MILILNCDFDTNAETNGAELLKNQLKKLGENSERFNVFENQFPEDLKIYSGILITGSRASVYEKADWIKKLSELVKSIDRLEIPTLGICFGFQIIAQSLGGEVKASGSFEEGFSEIELTPEGKKNFLFMGVSPKINVYQSHGDIATKLPEGSVVLSKNNHSTQAYSIRNFSCVQFHPEVLPPTARKMALRDGKNIENILNSINDDYSETLNILYNFLKFCGNR